jgi:thiol-disulfide isomerase/thioredoxin
MPAAESTMLPLGTVAPPFLLDDVSSGRPVSREGLRGHKALLVVFLSPHCPFVKHVAPELARIGEEYVKKGVAIVAISSNDADQYPADGPDGLRAFAAEHSLIFPVLYDVTQEVALLYQAACTPDFFLFDGNQALVYRGQIDDSRPKNETPLTGHDLRAALDAVLEGRSVSPDQKPNIGCNIKWKPGNEPAYFNPGK